MTNQKWRARTEKHVGEHGTKHLETRAEETGNTQATFDSTHSCRSPNIAEEPDQRNYALKTRKIQQVSLIDRLHSQQSTWKTRKYSSQTVPE